MFEAFTGDAREAIECAQREARGMEHGTVQVEHLLLGLFWCEDDIVSRVWPDFGLAIGPVRDMVRQRLRVNPAPLSDRRLRFSPAAKDTLRSAYRFGMGEPGPEHVLIVPMRRGEGGARRSSWRSGWIRTRFGLRRRGEPSRARGQGQAYEL